MDRVRGCSFILFFLSLGIRSQTVVWILKNGHALPRTTRIMRHNFAHCEVVQTWCRGKQKVFYSSIFAWFIIYIPAIVCIYRTFFVCSVLRFLAVSSYIYISLHNLNAKKSKFASKQSAGITRLLCAWTPVPSAHNWNGYRFQAWFEYLRVPLNFAGSLPAYRCCTSGL